jgi:Holliday junction DNA helicase RuvA
MIGRLFGRVIAQESDGAVVVDVGGVGYEVLVPVGTVGRTRADAEGRVTLFVHTHVREDALALFGFASDADRIAFRTLISISNVGPKTAIGILGAMPADELARAIAAKDLRALTSVPGIGKKIAERLLLELRDKLPLTDLAAPSEANAPAVRRTSGHPNEELLRSALTNLGYKSSESDRAIASLADRVHNAPIGELVREALAALAK